MVVHGKLPDESPNVSGMYQDWKMYKEYMEGKKEEYKEDTTRRKILTGKHQFNDGYYIDTTLDSIYEIANMKNVPYICKLANEETRSDAISKLAYLSDSNWNYVLLELVFMIVRYGNRDMNENTIDEASVFFKDVLAKYVWDKEKDDSNDKDKLSKRIDDAAIDLIKWNNLLGLKDIIEPIRKDTQERLKTANGGKSIDSGGDIEFEHDDNTVFLKCAGIRRLRYWVAADFYYLGEDNSKIKIAMGKYIHTNGSRQEGMFMGASLHGPGRQTFASGSVYEGEFKQDLFDGWGKYTWHGGDIYEGGFSKNKFEGWGKYISVVKQFIRYGTHTDGNLDGDNCIKLNYTGNDLVTILNGKFTKDNPDPALIPIKINKDSLLQAISEALEDPTNKGTTRKLTIIDLNNQQTELELPDRLTVEQLKKDLEYLDEQLKENN
jgi:hypothetical protein